MDVKLFIWKSNYGTWFMITESLENHFLHMQPIGTTALRTLQARNIPVKVF